MGVAELLLNCNKVKLKIEMLSQKVDFDFDFKNFLESVEFLVQDTTTIVL